MTDLSNEPATPRAELSPSDRRTIDRVATIVTDATTLDATIGTALNQLTQSTGGYNTTTPGASAPEPQLVIECPDPECSHSQPCPIHDEDASLYGPAGDDRTHQLGHTPADKTTPTERQAGRRDKAHADHQLLTKLLKRISRDTTTAAKISQRWGTSSLNAHEVGKRLNDALSSIWCANCSIHGFDKKRTNGEYCEFCSGIKSKYKRYPNHQLCAMNDAGQRCMPSDVTRAFKADKAREAMSDQIATPESITDARERRAKRLKDVS